MKPEIQRPWRLGAVLLALALPACGGGGNNSTDPDAQVIGGDPDAGTADGGGGACGDIRLASHIFNGTTEPTYVPLSPDQVSAVGAWTDSATNGDAFCSGTLITPDWVLTADHCGISTSNYFCFGPQASSGTCIQVAEVHTSPTITVGAQSIEFDLTVARLSVAAATRIPGITPIPVLTESLDATWVGRSIETAGFGQEEDGGSGNRLFALELIHAVGPAEEGAELLQVNGQGLRGVCFGDSGGPAMVLDSAGTVRVAGALSRGDSSCVDKDLFTRADLALAWIESFTGLTPTPDNRCGSVTGEGRCVGGRAVYCADEQLVNEACDAGETCGWDDGASGYRCITGVDSCGGVDNLGTCEGEIARWCEDGVAKQTDCACLGQVCAVDGSGAGCVADACMGLDFHGECQGDVARWCSANGELEEQDCAATQQVCGFVDDEIGYYCQDPA